MDWDIMNALSGDLAVWEPSEWWEDVEYRGRREQHDGQSFGDMLEFDGWMNWFLHFKNISRNENPLTSMDSLSYLHDTYRSTRTNTVVS